MAAIDSLTTEGINQAIDLAVQEMEGIFANKLADPTSAIAQAARYLPLRAGNGGPMVVDDTFIDGKPGWHNIVFKHTSNYGFHYTTGDGFAGEAIMAFGTDTKDAKGVLFSNKANGSKGLILDQFHTAGAATGQDAVNRDSPVMLVRTASIHSPAAVFTSYLANSKPVLSLQTGTWGQSRHVLMNHVDNFLEGATYWEVMAKDGRHNIFAPWHFGGSKADDNIGLTMRYNRSNVPDTELQFYRAVGNGTYYPSRIKTTTDELQLGVGVASALVDGSEVVNPAIRITASAGGVKLGLFGVVPVLRPTGVAVTTAAIHAALVSIGAIAA